jgi:superfamily I DNA/RNA helicase
MLAQQRGMSGGLRAGQRVLVLTFARQAVFHINQTLRRHSLRDAAAWIETTTFHGFCHRLVSAFGRYHGGKPNVEILSKALAAARCCGDDGQQVLDFSDAHTEAVSFDELVERALALLAASPRLRTLYAESFPVVVVDEVQDTDDHQVALIELLTEHSQLFCFGDPDQHIYGFRSVPADRVDRLANRWAIKSVVWETESHRTKDPFLLELGRDFLDERLSFTDIFQKDARRNKLVLTHNHERPAFRIYPIKNWLLKHRAGPAETNTCAILTHRREEIRSIAESLAREQEKMRVRFNCQLLYDDEGADVAEVMAHAWLWLSTKDIGSLRRVLAFVNAGLPVAKRFDRTRLEALLSAVAKADGVAAALASWPEEVRPLLEGTLVKAQALGDAEKVVRKLGPLFGALLAKSKYDDHVKHARVEICRLAHHDESGVGCIGAVGVVQALRQEKLAEAVMQKAAPLRGLVGLTMHASKGKEFDSVLIVPLTYMLAPQYFNKPDARKMWHVAVTRARTHVGFVLPDNWTTAVTSK